MQALGARESSIILILRHTTAHQTKLSKVCYVAIFPLHSMLIKLPSYLLLSKTWLCFPWRATQSKLRIVASASTS